MKKEIKIKVIFTPEYKQKFTAACLEVIRKRDNKKMSA